MKFSPELFTFTNHFNRSLLKSRIEMMNRRRSSLWALGKYAAFVAMLWVSAAFTKPYRQQIAQQIAKQVPELKEILAVKSLPRAIPKLRDYVWEVPKDSVKFESEQQPLATPDTLQRVSESKYVVYTPDKKLHFLITAKTSFDDLNAIRQEFKKNDMLLEVLEWQMDSMGRYLQKVSVVIHGLGATALFKSSGKNDLYEPIMPIAGILTLKPQTKAYISMTMGNVPHLQYLKTMAELDRQQANFDRSWTEAQYEHFFKLRKLGLYHVSNGRIYKKDKLRKDDNKYAPFRIVKNNDQKDKLKVGIQWQNAKFLLNDNHALLADIEDIDAENFIQAEFYQAYNKTTQKDEAYICVYTQKQSKY